jgi:hypothetical protein
MTNYSVFQAQDRDDEFDRCVEVEGRIHRSIATTSPRRARATARGAAAAPLGLTLRLPQSIFQAEKITLGTAGSPVGFL